MLSWLQLYEREELFIRSHSMCMCVRACMFVVLRIKIHFFFYYFTSKAWTFLKSEHILAGPRNFKGLFEGKNLV